MTAATLPRRAGFTLIELIVAITLIIILAALTAGVLQSGAIESQRVIQSADRVSGWLLIAKNRAARDRAARGVRFFRNTDPILNADATAGPGDYQFFVKEAQYIEGPDGAPYVPNPNGNPNGPRLLIQRTITDGAPPNEVSNIPGTIRVFMVVPSGSGNLAVANGVAANWMLVSPDLPMSLRLQAVTTPVDESGLPNYTPGHASNPLPGYESWEVVVEQPSREALRAAFGSGFTKFQPANGPSNLPPTNTSSFSTLNFAFQPPSSPLFGEPLLQLGNDVVIDSRPADGATGNPSTSLGIGIPTNIANQPFFDIVFAPSGQVLGNPSGILGLWVRDPNRVPDPFNFDNAGQQVLVVVYTRTGAISTQPVSFTGDPFQFAKDGINAGF